MKKILSSGCIALLASSITSFAVPTTNFTWTGASSTLFSTAGNWTIDNPPGAAPRAPSAATGDDAVIFQGGVSGRTVDLAATARNVYGVTFNSVAGANGFTFNVSGLIATSSSFGFNLRPGGIVNNDNDVQLFNVPLRLFTAGGGTPNTATIFTLNNTLSGGGLTFSGTWTSGVAGKETINMNGGAMVVDGVSGTTTTIGTTGGGIISGTLSTLTKNGAGVLTLGGTAANTYTGSTTVNGGTLNANKANALGTSASALTVNNAGTTLSIGANNQSVGAVTNGGGLISGSTGVITGSSYALKGGTNNAKYGGAGIALTASSGDNVLGAQNTYTGSSTIDGATTSLTLAIGNAISSSSAVTIKNGGTLNTAGFSEAAGTLTLTSSGTIDFGSGTSALSFTDSSSLTWSGVLDLLNWTAGSDTLQFGNSSSALTSGQLADIVFGDLGNAPAQIDANGFVTPVPAPEPSTFALGLLGGLGALVGYVHRRRR